MNVNYKPEDMLTIGGKRKTAVAKATIRRGSGQITVNKKPKELLPNIRRLMLEEPIEITKEVLGKFDFDISINVRGGGAENQIEAARLAMSKALVAFVKDEKLRRAFLMYDRSMLIADVRRKETYKPCDSKARARRQRSKR